MKTRYIITLFAAVVFLASCDEKQEPSGGEVSDNVVIPELPDDPQPENTSFAHRIMLLQHTGTYCPNCPRLMSSLKELSEDDDYAVKYHHVAAHSYNEDGDSAYSIAAANLSQAFCSGYYPELTFNLTKESTGTSLSVDTIKEHIDVLHKDKADVGIAAAVQQTGNALGVNVQIKSAKENQYRIAVWLLEDGIKCRQDGASEEWMNTHVNAIRVMAGSTINLRIYGEKVGLVKVGETAEKSFAITLDQKWNADNCKVLVVVNAAGSDGRFDLANCVICPIGEEISYIYN